MAEVNGYDLVLDPAKTDLKSAVMELTNGIGADITFEVAGLCATIDQVISITRQGVGS